MYADFSTLKLHINEKELDTLRSALELLYKINGYIEEEDTVEIILDFKDDDKTTVSTFKEKVLYNAMEALEVIIDY